MALEVFRVNARNLPEHANNAIHTDAGAQAAGYPTALVAGVTTYAYLTHVPASAWGLEWVRSGSADVRFLAPVSAGDLIACTPGVDGEATVVNAVVDTTVRASCSVQRVAEAIAPASTTDEHLPTIEVPLVDLLDNYGTRCGDPLSLYDEQGIVHPAVWPVLANRTTSQHLVTGSWIHTRSLITHLGLAEVGSTAEVAATVTKRFDTKAGERAIIDVRISVEGKPVAQLEHESIVSLVER
jgi:acyl dehydratase